MTARDPKHCKTCGASSYHARPQMAGKSRASCPTCGCMRSKWLYEVEVDETLPDGRGSSRIRKREEVERIAAELQRQRQAELQTGTYRKVSDKQKADAAWQDAHERKMAALRRLGLDVRANDGVDHCEFINERPMRDIQEIESKTDPRGELLAAARAGDRYAMKQADGIFENWRVAEKRRTA